MMPTTALLSWLLCDFLSALADFVFSAPQQWDQEVLISGASALDWGKAEGQKFEKIITNATSDLNSGSPFALVHRQGQNQHNRDPAPLDNARDVIAYLTKTENMFNQANSLGLSEAEKAIEKGLADAMQSKPRAGRPALPVLTSTSLTCLPDVNRCPKLWERHGTLCKANANYTGGCKKAIPLFEMSVEERLAFARFCKTEFQCQEDCGQNFEVPCPSLWREISANICQAPNNYVGECDRRLRTNAMSDDDKAMFGFECGARWPCLPPPAHAYGETCPEGWALQFGQTCSAPTWYQGPCQHFVQMRGMTVAEKQTFENVCDVSWPDRGVDCERDYASHCPYGWQHFGKNGKTWCVAPPTYDRCARSQEFSNMSPEDKRTWEQNCEQRFPCRSRAKCSHNWQQPCPADWFLAIGEGTCIAPATYVGNCSQVLRDLYMLTTSEKMALATRCDVQWPCHGEIFVSPRDMAVEISPPSIGREDSFRWKDGPL